MVGAALVVAGCALRPATLRAQSIRRSQEAWVRQKVADTWIDIHYRRPVARGRDLFGGIVQWGRPWTPGADSATTIRVSNAIRIEDQSLPAGTYSVWMIPDSAGAWTVILSKAQPVFHIPYPGEDQDLMRLHVTARTGEMMETLAFYFPRVDGAEATLVMHWGTTVVPLAIRAGP